MALTAHCAALLRRREVWVAGSRAWCSPEADLPADFEVNRDVHYTEIRIGADL